MAVEKDKWYDVKEQRRIYGYAEGELELIGVIRFKLSASGNHYLDMADGSSAVVSPGWRYMKIFFKPGESWTVN